MSGLVKKVFKKKVVGDVRPRVRSSKKTTAPKTTMKVSPSGIHAKKSGKHKGATMLNGVGCKGVHPFLQQVAWPWYHYAALEKKGLRKEDVYPTPDVFTPPPPEVRQTTTKYGKHKGSRLDRNATLTIELTQKWKLPFAAWYDLSVFETAIKNTFRPKDIAAHNEAIVELRKARRSILPEAQIFWAFCDDYPTRLKNTTLVEKLPLNIRTPLSTQVRCVMKLSKHTQSAQLDVLLKDSQGKHIVCEIKCGSVYNYGWMKNAPDKRLANQDLSFRNMSPPLQNFRCTTYNQYMLQTAVEDRIYQVHTAGQGIEYASAILLRIDRTGAYCHYLTRWAKSAAILLLV